MARRLKQELARILQRWPVLHRSLVKGYNELRFTRLMERFIGTRAREREWARRDNSWIKGELDSVNHPHRAFLVKRIAAFSSVSSILEVGCGCGPNLHLLAEKFPNAQIKGIDINPVAVQKGNEWIKREGISNVELYVGKADELQFQDKSFDVALTDAVLMYVGPDKIKKVMGELIRVTRRALILVEWHSFEPHPDDPYDLGVHHYLGVWERDYVSLLKQFGKKQIRVIKIPERIWSAEGWKELGVVIEVGM